jgi:hypothetical protein
MRIGVYGADGLRGKDWIAVGTCDSEPLKDIAIGFFEGERKCPAANGDALAKLPELVALEHYFKLGLTSKDNLQQFLTGRLEIQEQPDLFQGRRVQALRLVDN